LTFQSGDDSPRHPDILITKEAQWAEIAASIDDAARYLGKKPNDDQGSLKQVQDKLGLGDGASMIARAIGLPVQTVLRIRDTPKDAKAELAKWGMYESLPTDSDQHPTLAVVGSYGHGEFVRAPYGHPKTSGEHQMIPDYQFLMKPVLNCAKSGPDKDLRPKPSDRSDPRDCLQGRDQAISKRRLIKPSPTYGHNSWYRRPSRETLRSEHSFPRRRAAGSHLPGGQYRGPRAGDARKPQAQYGLLRKESRGGS
jgi:hypothetical protein